MSDTDALYNAVILDHDRAPRNCGPLRGATHSATADNAMCGDTVTMHAIVVDGRVTDATFEARGCALCRAAASLLTERIMNESLAEIDAVIDTFEGFLTGSDADRRTVELGDLRTFEAAKRVRARRTCMLLPFRAIAKALGVRSGL